MPSVTVYKESTQCCATVVFLLVLLHIENVERLCDKYVVPKVIWLNSSHGTYTLMESKCKQTCVLSTNIKELQEIRGPPLCSVPHSLSGLWGTYHTYLPYLSSNHGYGGCILIQSKCVRCPCGADAVQCECCLKNPRRLKSMLIILPLWHLS